jgi:hypothetical protein
MSFAKLLNYERANAIRSANKPFEERFATAIKNFAEEIVQKIPELKTEFIENVRANLNSLSTSINVPMNVNFEQLLMPGEAYYVDAHNESHIVTAGTPANPHIVNYLNHHCEELQRVKNFFHLEFSGCTVHLISEKNELKIQIAHRCQHFK